MLDTVVMTTESLTTEQYAIIMPQLQLRTGTSLVTGEVGYERYVQTLAVPTTGAQLRSTVDTAKWVKMPGEKAPHKVAMKSLRIEGSVHKAMHGHNVYGGEPDPQEGLRFMLALVAEMLSCDLPSLDHWKVSRIDFAASFDLASLENVRGWIRAKSLVVYPRRAVDFFGDLGLQAVGTTTTLRAYAKGPQFHKEGGYQALLKAQDPSRAFEVARIADRTLRCEVEVKAPKLEKLIDNASDLTEGTLRSIYEEEWRKLLRPIDSDSRLAHTAIEVANRLSASYPDNWISLYLVWCTLAVRGEGWYRQHIDRSTWSKQRRKLEAASVSWESTNVLTIDAPEDVQGFFPSLEEPRRLREVLPYQRVAS